MVMWKRNGDFDWHGVISMASILLPMLFLIVFGIKSMLEDKKVRFFARFFARF